MLLTILGEVVLPSGGRVWQQTLVGSLEVVGTTAPAARQAVARASQDGWLRGQRLGRRSLMTLTDDAWHRLVSARDRLFTFGVPAAWDGRWLLIVLSVPEQRREIRRWIQTQLTWLGFGSLGNGIWISPHSEHEEAARTLLEGNADAIVAFTFTAEASRSQDPRDVARMAWDLEDLETRYIEFHQTFSRAKPRQPAELFNAWIRLVAFWRRFPALDPELPESLLPGGWPGPAARQLFHRCYAEWADGAREFFRSLEPEGIRISK